MKSAMLTGIREMEISEVAQPQIVNDTDVLLKIEKIGVCGSDVHYYTTGRIGSQVVEYPFAVGHECSATVAEVGSAVTSVKPGDAVAVEPLIHCGVCDQCRAGRPHTCRKALFLGCPGQLDGCLSEYLVMPEMCCMKLPGNMSLEDAALVEPLTIGLYAVKLSGMQKGARVGILGAGPIGLSVLTVAQAFGAEEVVMTEPIAERRALAQQAGACLALDPEADTFGSEFADAARDGFDIVFECAGKQESFDNGVESLAPGGKFTLIGIPEFDRYSFVTDIVRRRELSFQNVRRQNSCAEECIRLMGEGLLDPSFMVTHRMPFAEVKRAFDLVDSYSDGVVKVMVEM